MRAAGFTAGKDYHPRGPDAHRALDSIDGRGARCALMRCAACKSLVRIAAGERVGFRDTCESCHADLHACCNCAHHDRSAYNECREPSAERVSDRERANRCDWFGPTGEEGAEVDSKRVNQLTAAEALFKK